MILIGQATVSTIANPVYKSGNLVRLNFLLMLLALGTGHILKALLILILIDVELVVGKMSMIKKAQHNVIGRRQWL